MRERERQRRKVGPRPRREGGREGGAGLLTSYHLLLTIYHLHHYLLFTAHYLLPTATTLFVRGAPASDGVDLGVEHEDLALLVRVRVRVKVSVSVSVSVRVKPGSMVSGKG